MQQIPTNLAALLIPPISIQQARLVLMDGARLRQRLRQPRKISPPRIFNYRPVALELMQTVSDSLWSPAGQVGLGGVRRIAQDLENDPQWQQQLDDEAVLDKYIDIKARFTLIDSTKFSDKLHEKWGWFGEESVNSATAFALRRGMLAANLDVPFHRLSMFVRISVKILARDYPAEANANDTLALAKLDKLYRNDKKMRRIVIEALREAERFERELEEKRPALNTADRILPLSVVSASQIAQQASNAKNDHAFYQKLNEVLTEDHLSVAARNRD